MTDERGCWVWQGAISNQGYGQIGIGGKVRSTHRVAYEIACGDIPDGLELDHLCRNRACCNPDHLEAVTKTVNMRRSPFHYKAHCIHGHALTGDNLIIKSRGKGRTPVRNCRTCQYAAYKRWREAERQAS